MTIKQTVRRNDLLYPELSYRIIGILFTVFNNLGYQYQERYYQRAIRQILQEQKVVFREQVAAPIVFQGKSIGRYFFDFLIENRIILEIKRGDRFSPHDIKQTAAYLTLSGLRLVILARFSSHGLKYRRIVNIR